MYLTISARWGLTSLSIPNEQNFCRGSFCAECTFGFWFCLSGVEEVNSFPLSTANKIGLLQRQKILRRILTSESRFLLFQEGHFSFFFKILQKSHLESQHTSRTCHYQALLHRRSFFIRWNSSLEAPPSFVEPTGTWNDSKLQEHLLSGLRIKHPPASPDVSARWLAV